MKLHWSLRLLLAAFAGYVWSLPFLYGSLTPFGWIVLGLPIFISMDVNRRLAFASGFVFGAAFHAASLSWVYTVMRVHGGLGPLAAAGVMTAMVLYLALYPAVFSYCIALLGNQSRGRALLAAPFLWVALEFAQTHAPIFGFPWNLAGYVAAKSPALIQLASVTGIYGLSFFMAACGSLFVWVMPSPEQPKWRSSRMAIGLGAALVVVIGALAGGLYLPPLKSDRAAVLVQLNFPQAPAYPANWMDVHAGEMDELERMSVEAVRQDRTPPARSLVIWPEVPAPFYFLDLKFAARAERIARDSGAHFLVGVVEWKRGAENRKIGRAHV